MTAKVLIVGSGGREHALGWKIAQSPEVAEVLYAPGNAGTALEMKGRNVPLDAAKEINFPVLTTLLEQEHIDLTVVGPEDPLANGIVDYLRERGHRVFGPTQAAARLEADKFYSYELMDSLNISQAMSALCYDRDQARKAIMDRATSEGIVLKARGLAAGKGVLVCKSKEEALRSLDDLLEVYGGEVVVAQRLFGQEFSVFGISTGEKVIPLEASFQDHKPVFDHDQGPNTGGMGAYGPAPIASKDVVRDVTDRMMTPIARKMKKDGVPYHGFLYGGFMMTKEGPKVLEFNARFGDPECQPAMMLWSGDLYHALNLAAEGKLEQEQCTVHPGVACCVVLASQGYPGPYKKGLPISGLEEVAEMGYAKVFHAGTKHDGKKIVTNGGRVLGVTACAGQGLEEAQRRAYEAAAKITIPGGFHYRRDIGSKGLWRMNHDAQKIV